MPILSRKSQWQRDLRKSAALQSLRMYRLEEFPLRDVQDLTDRFLKASTSFLARESAQSRDWDSLLLSLLGPAKSDLYAYAAGSIACMHRFTYDGARNHLRSNLKPDYRNADQDCAFDEQVDAYLQCIVLSHRASPDKASRLESRGAQEILNIIRRGSQQQLPGVMELLKVLPDGRCEELLPTELIKAILERSHYKIDLRHEMGRLMKARRWASLYGFVHGLGNICDRPNLDQLLPSIFSEHAMWARWQPDLARIENWESRITKAQAPHLLPVFDLEGPDITMQQRPTLRCSDEGPWKGSKKLGMQGGKDILDQLVETLDSCLAVGPNAVDLYIQLCVKSNPLTWYRLEQVEAVLELRQEAAAKTILDLIYAMEPKTAVQARVMAFSSALALLQTSRRLQNTLGLGLDLVRRGPAVLVEAQTIFCKQLQGDRASQNAAIAVLTMGLALLDSAWLHSRWKPEFIDMLQGMPAEAEILARLAAIRESRGPSRLAHMDYLAQQLGGSSTDGKSQRMAGPPVIVEDPIWHEVNRDRYREHLAMILRGMREEQGVSLELATRCLQSVTVPQLDWFVKELVSILIGDSDQVCVNLARVLGPRAASGMPVADCWKDLLLHLMRRRPPGLLERQGAKLSEKSWHTWIDNLYWLYGDGHLGIRGGLGFTAENIAQITASKAKVRNYSRLSPMLHYE
ncbi:hypothetical protein GQ53DRAFT_839929 [Thozetella sp. PMI_491]|nr:hypothetical protein GQ53DRAFT_839929 [Thozetella sp. PMI_491]